VPVLSVLRFAFTTLLVVTFAWVILEARGFPTQAAIFPLTVGSAGLALAVMTVVIDFRRYRLEGSAVGGDAPSTASTAAYEPGSPIGYVFGRAGKYLLWMIGYLALMFIIGLVAAAAVFVTAFLFFEAKVKLRYLWLAPVAVVGLLLTLANAVNLFWPRSLFTIIG
jgi:hypothetical protein